LPNSALKGDLFRLCHGPRLWYYARVNGQSAREITGQIGKEAFVHHSHNRIPAFLSALLTGALVFGISSSAHAQPAEGAPDAPAEEAAPAEETPAPDAAPAEPEGPSADDMAKAKEHYMKGKELFDAKDFESAVDKFKESYKLSKNAVLLYNIAFTHDEIGDKQMAVFYYEKFLRDTDKGAANRDVARKRLRELKKEMGGTTDTGTDVQAVTAFKHTVVDEAPPNTPLDIVAVVPEGVPWRVVMNYRIAGQAKFTAVEMTYRFKELVARIPATATASKNVQYYIEVKDGSGKVLERSGEPTSPHIVYMEEGAKPRFYADATNTGKVIDNDDPGGFGGGSSSGGGSTRTNGGWTDVQSSKFNKLKWGTTGGAAGLVLASLTFYWLSSDFGDRLEDESLDSQTGQCGNPPCKQFAQKQKDLQSLGKTYETLGSVALGLGVATAGVAGYLWYLEMTDKKGSDKSVTTIPVIGNDYVGAAAALRF
jgi:tetratricopeptide (TPR) repeat protein